MSTCRLSSAHGKQTSHNSNDHLQLLKATRVKQDGQSYGAISFLVCTDLKLARSERRESFFFGNQLNAPSEPSDQLALWIGEKEQSAMPQQE